MRKINTLMLIGLLCTAQFLWAQTRLITGKITDERDGSPIFGATVSVKETNVATITDANGNFSIQAPANATLVVSYVGYAGVEIPVSKASSIRLAQGSNALSEVVVVGYGQTLKKELTSSVTRVKGSEVANTPVPNFNQALQGRAAGVFVESNNGKVGEGVKVRIRGQGSINASNAPLYVVDGIPISTGSLSGNALADLNFNDVESFEVLKDAAATAIYGSRAANGVVLITTKKGRSGAPKFTVGLQYGSNKPTNKRGFLNAAEYIELLKEGAIAAGKYHYNRGGNWRGYASEQAAVNDMITYVEGRFTRYSGHSDWRKLETDTNWEELAFQDANVGAVDVSASGGNERTRYYISGSYNNQDGILFGNNFDRISGRINLDQQLADKFKIGLNLSVARTNAQRVADDNEFFTPMQIVALAPITPVRNLSGSLYTTPTTTYYNPLIETENSEYKSYTFRNIGTVFGQYDFTKNLFLRTEFGIDLSNQNDEEFYGSKALLGNATNGFGRSTWLRNTRYTTNTYANFKKSINDLHSLDATIGFAFEKGTSRSTFTQGEQFPSDDLRSLDNAGKITDGGSSLTENAIESYFGRVNYAFKGKYLLGVSGRYDGSSVFGINKPYGFFPSVSAGWVISEENFLKSSNTVSFLKLRGSYGQLGNSLGFGSYSAQPAFVAGRYAGISVLVPSRLGNNDLTWETSNQFDAGLEVGFFKNRLTAEIDYYDKRSAKGNRGFIFNLPVPFTSGYGSFITNLGEIQNSGVEFSINSTNIAGRDFRWSTSFNIAYNKNKVLKIDGDQDTLSFNDGRYMNALIVGQPIGVHYGQKYAGVDPQNGDALYFEQDGKTTTNDYNEAGVFVVGDPNPKYYGGITNNFSYKGIELSVLFQGVFDYDIVNGAGGFMSARADWFDNQTRDQLNRWRKPGDQTNIPEARLNRFGDFASPGVSTQYMEDGSYIRLKNVTLAYNFPAKLLSRARLSSVRLYITGINLATFTDYTGWDPEVNTDYRAGNINQGGDFYAAPQIKSIVFGLNIGF
jgi:TonB-linked SusC/RagA family outer membrane protein